MRRNSLRTIACTLRLTQSGFAEGEFAVRCVGKRMKGEENPPEVYSKYEILNSKSDTNSNDENLKFKVFWSFGHWNFDIVSDLGFRASNFDAKSQFFTTKLRRGIIWSVYGGHFAQAERNNIVLR